MENTDHRLQALADPTRRAILARLAQGEATVGEIAKGFDISQPAISHHLKILEEAGLIDTRIRGTARPRRLRREAVEELWDWLSAFRAQLADRYDRLDEILNDMEE